MCLAQQPDGSWCHPTVAWGCVLQWWDTVPSPPSEGVVPVPSCCTHGTWYPMWLLCLHTVKPCLIEPLPCPWVMGHD